MMMSLQAVKLCDEELMIFYLLFKNNKSKQSVTVSSNWHKTSLDFLGLKSMSEPQVVPREGEEVTAHSTLFTTEVDQRTDTGPWATWRREGAQHKG